MVAKAGAPLDIAVGMLYYITDCPGARGRVKERPEDFIVEEVLLGGEVVPTSITNKPIPRLQGAPGQWTWLIIEKRNVDAITLQLILARTLGVRPRDISMGGLKDAAAVTSQIVSVPGPVKVAPGQLARGVKVLAAFPMDKPFGPSQIWGNEFTVIIRGLGELGIVNCILEQLGRLGLPAYYGYQRFGVKRPNSHVIGKYLVLGMFEEAVKELLAHPYPGESPRVRELREYLARTWDCAGALEKFPRGLKYIPERLVLKHLASNPRDYVGALRKLPRQLLAIYVEAYQSYLFNLALSKRLGRGLPINEALEGDLVVLLDQHGLPTKHAIYVTGPMLERVNELIAKGRAAVAGHLVGAGTRMPPGVQGEIEEGVLKEEGIEPWEFRLRQFPNLSIRGGLRPLHAKPVFLGLEEVRGEGVRLAFRLPRGNYATVLLREIFKSDPTEWLVA